MIIRAKSPTRVDLAGGTLDCWPLYSIVGDTETTNLAIDVFTYADLLPRADLEIHLNIKDLAYSKVFSNAEELLGCSDRELALIREHVAYWAPQKGFELTTKSESPVGGGLGGSSSLCISLIKVLASWQEKVFSTYEMVTLAHNLEARVLGKPTGTQDYFPAIKPGLNVIHYTAEGPRLEPLLSGVEVFADRMFLVYTGEPHHSGLNNWQVIKAALDKDQNTLLALEDLRQVAKDTAQCCRDQKWSDLAGLFGAEFEARVRLSKGFSSDRIEELRKVAMGAGAEAVKICGAGGGGCVLVWCSPREKEQVQTACLKSGFQIINARPTSSD